MIRKPIVVALSVSLAFAAAQGYGGSSKAYLLMERLKGLLVFTTPVTKADGFGDGPFIAGEGPSYLPGSRPTLQGNGTFLRVNGLDAQSCNECHSIVKHSTVPPTLGIGGVGGISSSPMPQPTMIDVADSHDNRTQYQPGHHPDLPMKYDGIADFDGRLINPPFLFGGGGVELVGKEMTADLQELLAKARRKPAGTQTPLTTHGVNFGYLVSTGNHNVNVSHVEGIGLETDTTAEDLLVVRPFGRKGSNFSMRDFDRGAMEFHLGMQPVEVVGENVDADHDGVVNEVTIDQMTNLHIFDVTNPRPVEAPLCRDAYKGKRLFESIGCTECHIPMIKTHSYKLPLAFPEVATDPYANVYIKIDLKKVGFERAGSGVEVPFFADLKRHSMGPRLAETFDDSIRILLSGVANDEFTTARLWGVGDTGPYLHDGRAQTLFEAIELLGGEAEAAREAFLALSTSQQAQVIAFLKTLRTPDNPNQELLVGSNAEYTPFSELR